MHYKQGGGGGEEKLAANCQTGVGKRERAGTAVKGNQQHSTREGRGCAKLPCHELDSVTSVARSHSKLSSTTQDHTSFRALYFSIPCG